MSVNQQHDSHEPDDQDLAAGIRAGDAGAYEQLYRLYYRRLCEFATFYVQLQDDADDIVSDVYAYVWEHRATWKPLQVETYLFGAVRNRALNAVRDARADRRRAVVLHDGSDMPGLSESPHAPDEEIEASSERSWRLAALRVAITALSDQQRTVLVLRWRFRKGWEEIAQILGISIAAAQMTHSRALSSLRERIGSAPGRSGQK
jgi:RNA polymerase sigma-70 factor (ECF subfamily)